MSPARTPVDWLASLRQRKVVQWTLAYAAAAAAVLQLVALVAAQFALPEALGRSATVLLACGLPVAAVIAWYHGDRGAQRVAGAELLILTLLFALAAWLLWRVDAPRTAPGSRAVASPAIAPVLRLAVLPLDHPGPDPANAYFAEGLHDELLTALTRLGSVEVVSRTTMQTYRDRRPPTRELGAELGATHVLEGSVQREAGTVRLNLQLIEVARDRHVWADSYTRQLESGLALQSEVALAVARQLRAHIAPAERRGLESARRIDPRALDLYLQARTISDFESTDALARRRALLDSAIAVEDAFGVAYAERASVLAKLHAAARGRPGDRRQAQADLDAALRLAPDEPATALAHVRVRQLFDDDVAGALAHAEAARQRWPLSAEIADARGLLCRELGRYDESLAAHQLAVRLDPRNDDYLRELLIVQSSVFKRYETGLELSLRLYALKPSPENRRNVLFDTFLLDADLAARVDGYVPLAAEAQADADFALERRWFVAENRGDWREADAFAVRMQALRAGQAGDYRTPFALNRLYYARRLGDAAAVDRHYATVLAELAQARTRGQRAVQVDADEAWAHAVAGDTRAARHGALHLLARARDAGTARDAMLLRNAAVPVLAAAGQRDAALALLRALLPAPWGWHPADAAQNHKLRWSFGDHAGYAHLRAELLEAARVRGERWRRTRAGAAIRPAPAPVASR